MGFEHCIVAAGSSPAWLPVLPDDERSWTPRARWTSPRSPSGCWSSAAGSSAWRWHPVRHLGAKVTVVELRASCAGLRPRARHPCESEARALEAMHLGTSEDAWRPRGRAVVTVEAQGDGEQDLRPHPGGGRAAAPTRTKSAPRRRGSTMEDRSFVTSTPPAHQRRPHLRHRRRRRGSPCSPTRPPTRPRWRPR